MTASSGAAGVRADEGMAHLAGIAAVRNMPADWYCPFDPERQRIDCPECVAVVALEAALPVLVARLRAVLDLADELDGLAEHLRGGGERAATLRAAASIRAAVTAAQDGAGQ